MENTLYYGDNLAWLQDERTFPAGLLDLVYLDPPFNSNRNYNVLFKSGVSGADSQAQIHAFTDTWEWSGMEYTAVIGSPRVPTAVKDALAAMVQLAGKNALTGYLVMMAQRLVELHRVLKPTGSLYLHCDPTASHYLKLILDAVFGPENFRNEITWKRTSAHNDSNRFGRIHDIILYYAKDTRQAVFSSIYSTYSAEYLKAEFKQDAEGRWYKAEDLTAPSHGGTSGKFEFHGRTPGPSRMWRMSQTEMERLWQEGRIKTDKNGVPLLRGQIVYLDEKKGMPVQDWWDDIDKVGNTAKERLGYPTQKPLALLERIIRASSNPGDVVLDPFCGCGTAVVAAEKLGRKWLGIDITSLAIGVIEKRMRQTYPDAQFRVVGLPDTVEDAFDLAERDKYDFQDWVVLRLGGQPARESASGKSKKGADSGIDGVIYFEDKGKPQKVIISVKGGKNVSVDMLRDLNGTVLREGAAIGVLVVREGVTKAMRDEAARAEPYESSYILRGHAQHYPRLQLLTVADLIAGHGVEMPPHHAAQTMQTAQRAPREVGEQGDLGIF